MVGALIYTVVMCIGISIWAIYFNDWANDQEYINSVEKKLKDIDGFAAPPFCIIPTLTISFGFQYYFLQVIHTLKPIHRPNQRAHSRLPNTSNMELARKIGFATILVVAGFYFLMFFVSWKATPNNPNS